MSDLLLGFVDSEISGNLPDTIDYSTDKLGGEVKWPYPVNEKQIEDVIKCPNCTKSRTFLLQINAPIDSKFERTFYVFGCINHECQKFDDCWLCLRLQKVCNEKVNYNKNGQNVTQHHSKTGSKDNLTPLKSYYICVEEDIQSSNVTDLNQQPNSVQVNYSNENFKTELYEKFVPEFGDKYTHKYLKEIRKEPQQLIRYCRNDSAILPFENFEKPQKKCSSCGGCLVFEFQIISTMLMDLYKDRRNEPLFDFSTLIVFTCQTSCWSSNRMYVKEHVFVQFEDSRDFLIKSKKNIS